MSIEEELKALMIKKFGSVNKFSHENGLSTSTVATIFRRKNSKRKSPRLMPRASSFLGGSALIALNYFL